MQIDVLVVGQGLAGSLLAYELIQRGCRVMVVDTGEENASQVAAGLINPVTGKRLVLQPAVDSCLRVAVAFYQQLAVQFQQPFFIERPMWRILRSVEEQEYADKRLSQAGYVRYLHGWLSEDKLTDLRAPYGVLLQRETGYLRTQPLLEQLRHYFHNLDSFRQLKLDYADIHFLPGVNWQGLYSKHIVFCEGYQALANPWFGCLPFQLAKGQILDCVSEIDMSGSILNYGKWLIPLTGQQFKTGASFETERLDSLPTVEVKNALLAELHKVYPGLGAVKVLGHKAGVRPATLDKQPLLGSHPQQQNLHIFNGFGSKGSLSIPWYAKLFADLLLQGSPLPETVDIKRYYETHFAA